MVDFEYYTPTKVIFGKNAEEKTGELVKAQGCKRFWFIMVEIALKKVDC